MKKVNDITKMHISSFERNINSGYYFAMANLKNINMVLFLNMQMCFHT